MNHPQREEWIPLIFGEASPENQKRLRAHLDTCSACAEQVEDWRRSLRRLDDWALPHSQTERIAFVPPMLKWAIAAVVVLGIGFVGGRLGSGGRTGDLRAALEASVQSSVRAEVDPVLLQVREENAKALREAELRLTQASISERERLWRGFLQVLSNARAEDAKTFQAAFREFQEQDTAELVALRKDLETLASATDDEIRAARLKLFQLAAATPQ